MVECCYQVRRLQKELGHPFLSASDTHHPAAVCASHGVVFILVSTAIQFTSQVLPPSSENDCSKRQEFGVMSEITNRTRMARPLNVSWSKNSPRPFLNSPIVGWLMVPP